MSRATYGCGSSARLPEMHRRWGVAAGVLATIAVVTAAGGSGAAGRATARTAAAKTFTATFKYRDTSGDSGPRTGNGTFSGKFTGRNARLVQALAAAAGIPYTAMTKGGRYAARFSDRSNGDEVGLIAARFKSAGVGTVCVRFTAQHGKYAGGG